MTSTPQNSKGFALIPVPAKRFSDHPISKLNEDEERHGGGGGISNSGFAPAARNPKAIERGLNSKAQIAAGYRPAVVKVVSFASGIARANATATYIQRDGVELETESLLRLSNHDEVRNEIAKWSEQFGGRKDTDDVLNVTLKVSGLKDTEEDRATLARGVEAAFDGHKHAWRIEAREDGSIQAQVVTVMAGEFERFRMTEKSFLALDRKSQAAMRQRLDLDGIAPERVTFTSGKPGNGIDALTYRLGQLVEGGPARAGSKEIKSDKSVQRIALAWKDDLNSFTVRDTMHMLVSANADTDIDAFRNAVRRFLHESFPANRYMWGIHADKREHGEGHIHAHVVVEMRGAYGDKLNPNITTFRNWREAFAEKAQAEGLKITASRASERASSQSYGNVDKSIIDAAEHPRKGREELDRAYAAAHPELIANARRRVSTARINPARFFVTKKQREDAEADLAEWVKTAKGDPENSIVNDHVSRLRDGLTAGAAVAELLSIAKSEIKDTSYQGLASTLAGMTEIVAKTSNNISDASGQALEQRAEKIIAAYENRFGLQRLVEGGQSAMTDPTVAKVLAKHGDDILYRVSQMEGRERRAQELVRRQAGTQQKSKVTDLQAKQATDEQQRSPMLDALRATAQSSAEKIPTQEPRSQKY
jgi:type IV secretion system T-DNA border endonuclease VirD2